MKKENILRNKNYYRFFWLSLFLAAQESSSLSPSKEAFFKRNEAPDSLKALLDTHYDEMLSSFEAGCSDKNCIKAHKVYTFPWLPGYLIKRHPHRMLGAEILHNCIEKNKLDLLVIPKKYLYHINGKPDILKKENYFVLAQKIESDDLERGPFDLKQVQQICKLIHDTKFFDLGKKNYFRLKDKKIALIDTGYWKAFESNVFLALSKFIFDGHNLNSDFTKEALEYLFKELAASIPTANQAQYAQIYRKIGRYLKTIAPRTIPWDYEMFFNNNLPAPSSLIEKTKGES